MIVMSIVLIVYQLQSKMTITYFPITENVRFTSANTNLYETETDETIVWETSSTTDQSTYLRQDVSLLFENGYLKGIQSKWEQNNTTISQQQLFEKRENKIYQAITYHHAEIHENSDSIFSIHHISNAEFFSLVPSIDKDKKADHSEIKKKMYDDMMDALHREWQNYFAQEMISENNYTVFPIVNMAEFEAWSLQRMSNMKVDEMIGQLWEGIYKNYVIRAMEENGQGTMPVILIANDLTHLLVLYNLNGETEKLIQQLH